MFIGKHMNKIIPITEKQFIRFQKTFYEFDDILFASIDSVGYIGWNYSNCFYNNDILFLDTATTNEILDYNTLVDARKVIRKILK